MRPLAIAAVLLIACGPSPRPGHPGTPAPVTLPPALALVSNHAPVVISIRDPAAADAGLGWSQVTAALGAPFIAPTALAQHGIAADRPIVLAANDPDHGVWTLTAELTDPDRAAAWAVVQARDAGVTLRESTVASARVFLPAGRADFGVVVRDRFIVFIFTPGPRSVRDLAAVRAAAIERTDSLAANPQVAEILGALPGASDASIYLDVDQLGRRLLAPGDRELTILHTLDDLERRLAKTRAAGGNTAALRQQVGLLTQISARARASRQLAGRLIAPLGAAAIGLSAAPDRLTLSLATRPAPGSLPDQLLSGDPTSAPLAHARPDALFTLDLHADPAAIATLVDALLASRGTSLAELADAGDGKGLALDLPGALRGNLTGQVGLALGPGQPPAVLATAELREPSRGRGLLDRVATAPLLRGRVALPKPGRVVINLPNQGTLALALSGHLLALSSSPSGLDALRAPPAAKNAPTAVVSASGALLPLLLGGEAPPPAKMLMLSDGSKAPISDELAHARDAVNEARASLTQAQADGVKRRLAYLTKMGEHAGRATLSFARRGTVVAATGDWRPPAASLRTALQTLATDIAGLLADRRDQAAREAKIRQSIDDLEQRAAAIRQHDVEAWKQSRDSGVGAGAPDPP